jgi:hypothetical protein
MSKFLKIVGKGIKHSGNIIGDAIINADELASLDKIVRELHKRCDKEFEEHIAALSASGAYSIAICANLEQQVFDRLNNDYDAKAKKCTGREVPATWRTDKGDDIIEVRKRILNRGFEGRRNRIFGSVSANLGGIESRFNNALSQLKSDYDAFIASTKDVLPMKPSQLQSMIDSNRATLNESVSVSFSGGIEALKEYSKTLQKVNETKENRNMILCYADFEEYMNQGDVELLVHNSNLIQSHCSEMRTVYMTAYHTYMKKQIQQTLQLFTQPIDTSVSDDVKISADGINIYDNNNNDNVIALSDLHDSLSDIMETIEINEFIKSISDEMSTNASELLAIVNGKLTITC